MYGERLIKHHISSYIQNLHINTHGMKAKRFCLVERGLARKDEEWERARGSQI